MTTQAPPQRLRVWVIINPPSAPEYRSVATPEEGAHLIHRVANEQLKDDRIWANAFGLEVFEDGEWTDWGDLEALEEETP